MSNVAIIPARAGSRRIPGKNIKLFQGRPIISYAIECAQFSGLFDQIVVSTDSMEIGDIAARCGAGTIERPAALAVDEVGTQAVMKHALEVLAGVGDHYGYVCCIYPCTPLLRPESLIEAYAMLVNPRHIIKPYVFAVGKFASPIHLALEIVPEGGVRQVMPQLDTNKSLPDRYYDAGQFYFGTTAAFLEGVDLYPNALPYVIPRAVDINDDDDWRLAELIFKGLNG